MADGRQVNVRKSAAANAAPKNGDGRASLATRRASKRSQHQRTLRDFYGEAVRARAGIKPDERHFDTNPSQMSPGEMLLWSLGGSVCDQELAISLENVATDILAFVMAPEAHGGQSLPGDACETIHGFVNRLQVIRWLHAGALERLGQIVVPEVHEEL
jgi:hypothetical protein